MSDAPAIPLLDLHPQNDPIRAELDDAIARVMDQQQFVLGPAVAAFEEAFAAYCGTRHAVGCGSGSDALLLSLMALEVGPGDQVLCPAFTFFATASAITRTGALPVLDRICGTASAPSQRNVPPFPPPSISVNML